MSPSTAILSYVYLSSGKLTGPLSDYHFQSLKSAWEQGVDSETAEARFRAGKLDGMPQNPVEELLNNLRSREIGLDVFISDYISSYFRCSKLFYSMNHPSNQLLVEMLRRLLARYDLRIGFEERATSYPYTLNQIDIPYPDYVRKYYRLNCELSEIKGRGVKYSASGAEENGITQYYDWLGLIKAFWKTYDAACGKRVRSRLQLLGQNFRF